MSDLARLMAVLDGADRLGAMGQLEVHGEAPDGMPRRVIVSKFAEEVGLTITMKLDQMRLSGAKFDSKTIGLCVAVGLEEGLKVLSRKLGEVRLNRSLDALEAQQAVAPAKAG